MMIYTYDGSFAFAIGMANPDLEVAQSKGSVSIRAKKGTGHAHITTNRGDFLEVVNAAGEVIQEIGDCEATYITVGKEPVTIRYRTIKRLNLSAVEIEKARKVVTRKLICDKPWNLRLPETLGGMIAWLNKQARKIPKGARAKATFNFGTTMEYGETYPEIKIEYRESESDAEVLNRVRLEGERSRIQTIRKRAQLAQLKAELKEGAP